MSNFSDQELKQEIYRNLLFFDMFNQPLTLLEIYKYINVKSSLDDLSIVLSSMSNEVSFKSGFYYLKGRDFLVSSRLKRYNYFNRKIKIARRFSSLLKFIPFVRAVFVSNIISSHNLRNNSDIDLFIISSSNRIWLTRFLCVVLAKVLNLRPNPYTKKDKICLSFYISEANMNLEKYMYSEDDLYFIHWLYNLELVMDKKKVSEQFISANSWITSYFPNVDKFYFNQFAKQGKKREVTYNIFWSFLDGFMKKFQLKIMPKQLLNQASDLGGVVLKDDIIKLFLEDRRPLFINKLKSKDNVYEFEN